MDVPAQIRARIRPPGGVVLLCIVALGMGIPAFFRWKAGSLKKERESWLRETEGSAEARLEKWFQFGQPAIHHALLMARFSDTQPWFVTHVIAPASAQEPPQIHGIDLQALPESAISREGLAVCVRLAAPELLARDVLSGDKALGVPVFPAHSTPHDARELALGRLVPYLARLGDGLVQDLPQTRLEVYVGDLKAVVASAEEQSADEEP